MTSAAGRQDQQLASSIPAVVTAAALWRRAAVWLSLLACLSVVAATAAAPPPPPPPPPPPSLMAPDFVLKSTQGDNLRLTEYRGEVMMLAFIKSRCHPCDELLRSLDTLNKRYAAQGLRCFALIPDLDLEAAAVYASDLRLSFPLLIDKDRLTALRYQAELMPTLVLVDKDGNQRHVHQGFRETDIQSYENELRQLLSEWQ